MTQESIEQLLAYTIPIYSVVILAEIIVSFIFEKHYFTTKDTLTNAYLTALNFGFDVLSLEKEMENYQDTLEFRFSKSNDDAKDPKYAYTSDSGFDLYSVEDKWIHQNDRALISTGLHLDIPEGYEVQVRSKSGLAINQGLFVLNSPGTVDEGYTGEIKVILFNSSKNAVTIKKGSKIAQAVLCPVVHGQFVQFNKVENIENKDRGDNGFGSTGI